MSCEHEFVKAVGELSHEIAAARRQLNAGKAVHLEALPGRLQDLLDGTERFIAKAHEAPLLALMAECDQLVRDIEDAHKQLRGELRSDRVRQQAVLAYRSPNKGTV